jgi:lycopene beta-cyclase
MDIIIAGTGASAMLLASSLIRRQSFRTLKIIGERRPMRAHRLSYWSEEPTPFDEYTDATWDAVRIVDATGHATDAALTRFRYRTFPTTRWFGDLEQKVLASPGVELVDMRLTSMSSDDTRARVRSDAEEFEADWVFSSVPLGTEHAQFWQRFEGWEVSVANGSIDTRAATLLDFRTPADNDFRFCYALPLSPTHIFLEHVSYEPCRHADHLTAYLTDVLNLNEWIVVDREHGATPAHRGTLMRQDRRLIHIGVAGGLAKAATGYALMRMWRDAELIADGLAEEGHPRLSGDSQGLYRLADRYFLHLLGHDRSQIPVLLAALFSGASGDAVLAFLDDRATPRELASVSLAVPGWMQWWARHASRKG